MFYCFIHNWYSVEKACPACNPIITTSASTQEIKEPQPTPDVFQWDEKCLSLNDILDCWYSDEDFKKLCLSHSEVFYREELKNNNPLFTRLKRKIKASKTNSTKEEVKFQRVKGGEEFSFPTNKKAEFYEYNPQPKEVSKDWEIVEYCCGYMGLDNVIFKKEMGGQFRTFDFRLISEQKKYSYPEDAIVSGKIHSVKRLSDNLVFTVGDEVYYDESGNASLNLYSWRIDNFYIRNDGVMLARSKNEGVVETIDKNCYLKKSKPQSKEPDRIEVEISKQFNNDSGFAWQAHLYSTNFIPKEKFPLIKQAIEGVLNGDGKFDGKKFDRFLNDEFGQWGKSEPLRFASSKKYTQEQVDKMIKDMAEASWYAARDKSILDRNPQNKQYRYLSFDQWYSSVLDTKK